MPSPITYGQAKERFAFVYNDGTGTNNPKLLPLVNNAIESLMRDVATVNPRGVYVGGIDQFTYTLDTNRRFTLDATHDVVLSIEISTQTDINNGWYADADLAGLVDPDFANDVIFIPQGLDANGNRTYQVPAANPGDTVTVMAKKRFVSVALDTDVLPVWNVEAIMDYMLYLQKKHGRDNMEGAVKLQASALASMKAELDGYLMDPTRSLARKAAYQADEKTYAENTLGYVRAFLAQSLPGGLKIGKSNITRGINEAVREAVNQRNALGATETYSDLDGPDVLPFVRAVNATDVLSYANLEVLRLLCLAQSQSDGDSFKQQAFALIERNITKAVMATRNAKWHCLLHLPRFTYGWMRGTVGLGLAERGFSFPDQKIGRMVNDAEDALSRLPNFKNGEAHYALIADNNGIVTLPADAERIIYADVCGIPLQTKHRSFEYLPVPSGYGVQPNYFSTFPHWGFAGPFGYRGRAQLQDRGYDANGNRTYYMAGCWVVNLGTVDSSSAGANVSVVVKRRFLPKTDDNDVMMVQNVEAIRTRVESEIARLDGKQGDFEALRTASERAMDEQILDEKAGEEVTPKFSMPGRNKRGGIRTLYRGGF